MSIRSLFIAAVSCSALALPMVASADTPVAQGNAPATPQAACDCSQCNHANANANGNVAAATRVRRHHRHVAPAPLAAMNIDSRISRDVADGCRYTAQATGTYRAPLLANSPNGRVRDVHVVASTSLTCEGKLVRRQSQRWELPSSTRSQLTQAMHDRLAIQVPGSSCTFASNYGFQGGNLLAQSADSSCSRGDEVAALRGFERNDQMRATPSSAVGGGPREPTSSDARYGTH